MNLKIDNGTEVNVAVFKPEFYSGNDSNWQFLQEHVAPLRDKNSPVKAYSLPQLIQLLVDTSYDSPLWAIRELIAVNSVESIVWDRKYPSFGDTDRVSKKEIPLDDLLVIMHGDNHLLNLLTLKVVKIEYDSGVRGYFPPNITDLLAGKFFGEDIPVFNYEQFLKESGQPDFDKKFSRYAVILPSSIFRKANLGKNIDELAGDPLFIVRNGGEKLAKAHIDKIKGMAKHFEKDRDTIKMRYFDLEKRKFEDKLYSISPFSFNNAPVYSEFPAPKLIMQDTSSGLPMPIPKFSDISTIMGLDNGSCRGFLSNSYFSYGCGLISGDFCPLEHQVKN